MSAVFPAPFTPGHRLHDGDALNRQLASVVRSTDSGVTALGTNQATAYQLVASFTDFTTVASSTGAKLPKPVAGTLVVVFNDGANPLTVYGNASDTIDGTAGATGVTLTNAKRCAFFCMTPTTWISAQLGVVSA